jgi:hypothetical protein
LAGKVLFGWFLDALPLRVSPPGQEVAEDVVDGLAAWPAEACVSHADLLAGLVAGDADGHGEGDPVRVDPGGAGRFGLEGAQCLVGGDA